ncbi:MAG: cytochrome c maturation protein CcmE [Pseudomonadota bacterium]
MTRKQKRGFMIGTAVTLLATAVVLVMFALRDTVVFFHSPSEIAEKGLKPGERFRLGGLVADGSVVRGDGTQVRFKVTDTGATLPVTYDGILPDLFREGQGVVAEGRLNTEGTFVADTVLAKHDENYMPPEVAAALEKRGVKLDENSRHPGKITN